MCAMFMGDYVCSVHWDFGIGVLQLNWKIERSSLTQKIE